LTHIQHSVLLRTSAYAHINQDIRRDVAFSLRHVVAYLLLAVHMKLIPALLLGTSLAFCHAIGAQEFFWRDERGQPAPATDARKSERGFGGWLVITSDGDWEAKWNVPKGLATPAFNEADSLKLGESVVALIFIVNPLPNAAGNGNVRCDLRVTRPNGSVSVEQRDLPCLQGPLPGDPLDIRLAAHTLQFVGEAGDPLGTWVFHVTLRDVERGVLLNLSTSVDLLGDG
jgi:hypothetical protein